MSRNWGWCRRLQRLAEGLLRFVVLVAVALVKLVRALANHVRTHRHALASVFAGPVFSGCEQLRARAQAAVPVRDDQPVDLRADFALQQRLLESEVRAEVNGLVVADGHRSLGAGAQLLAAAEDWARKHGCKGMSVRSNVIREGAHKFYERNGYEHYKTQKSFRKPL